MSSSFSRSLLPVLLTIGVVAGAAVVASSNSAMSHEGLGDEGHGHMTHHHGEMSSLGIPLPILLRSANLTDAQKEQIHQIFSNRHTARETEFRQLKAAQDQIAAKFVSPGPVTANDLSAPVQQIAQIRSQMTQEELQDALAIRKVLTPAQVQGLGQTKSKLDQIRNTMRGLFGKGDAPKPDPAK